MEGAEPTRREGVLLEAGEGSFPLALERQLVGQHRGAHLSLDVPYPADYAEPVAGGQDRALRGRGRATCARRSCRRSTTSSHAITAQRHARASCAGRIRADLERAGNERADGAGARRHARSAARTPPLRVRRRRWSTGAATRCSRRWTCGFRRVPRRSRRWPAARAGPAAGRARRARRSAARRHRRARRPRRPTRTR